MIGSTLNPQYDCCRYIGFIDQIKKWIHNGIHGITNLTNG